MTTSKHVTIFEGPDGGGKTTAARKFAEESGARYVHLGPFPQVTSGLARLYVEAMLPAVLGYQSVVLDRCWLSEVPYGAAFRNGHYRLSVPDRRMLERLALRCSAVVVKCLPPWETVKTNYLSRKHLEMLENDRQLKEVYHRYEDLHTDLPTLHFNYAKTGFAGAGCLATQWTAQRTPAHPLSITSAGNWAATTVLVGEGFGDHKDSDPFYQWPFASFNGAGCSRWLTEHLEFIGKSEHELLWVNADQDLAPILGYEDFTRTFYALGDVAHKKLDQLNVQHQKLTHPQFHKRFHSSEPYPLRFT